MHELREAEKLARDALATFFDDDEDNYAELRKASNALDAALALPDAQPAITTFDHLTGRGMHELRLDKLTPYLVSLAISRGPESVSFSEAVRWVVSDLERKTKDERVLAHALSLAREALEVATTPLARDRQAVLAAIRAIDAAPQPALAPELVRLKEEEISALWNEVGKYDSGLEYVRAIESAVLANQAGGSS